MIDDARVALVAGAVQRGAQVIDRCNLTILFEPGQEKVLTHDMLVEGLNVYDALYAWCQKYGS